MTDTSNAWFRYEPNASLLSARPLNGAAWGVTGALILVPILAIWIAGALTPGQGAGWPLIVAILFFGAAYFTALQLLKTKSRPR